MSGSASARLAERYALQLSAAWQSWFDERADTQRLAGQFRQPLLVDDLIERVPVDLWPGFMLPDTLPIVSNEYGDWWCVRVGSDNQITEVIQWMHAGGDWLPVGANIFEAILWDWLQHWRGQFAGRQPAAHEYPKRPAPLHTASEQQFASLTWLAEHLTTSATHLQQLLDLAAAGDYRISLELMQQHHWADFAAACELIEVHLQGGLVRLADAQVASRCGINWSPDFTSWLFDTDRIPGEARQLLLEHCPGLQFTQDWHAAGVRAEQVLQRRSDLGWAGDIAGWAAERRGDEESAIAHYFQHRTSSAFTDQSLRLRSHWFSERFGKFSVAQLARLYDHLSPQQRDDPYLQIFWHEPGPRVRPAIREYWLARARSAEQQHDFATAYDAFYRAGWDLGAERLSDYIEILDGLARSAQQAQWQARSLIAQTHADSLRRRLITD